MDSPVFFFGALFGAFMAVLIACASDAFVNRRTLERNGYRIVEYSETHGEFHTNWVEVVRADGRPL